MLTYVSAVRGMTRRGLRLLSLAVMSGAVACAQADVTSPTHDRPTTGGEPPLPPLAPWSASQSPTWAPSNLLGSLLFSRAATVFRVAPDGAAPQPVMEFPYQPEAVYLSPNGTRAATLHSDGFSNVLCVAQSDIGGGLRCARSVSAPIALAWTPDGQALMIGGRTPGSTESVRLSIVDPVTLEFRPLLLDDGNVGNTVIQDVTFTPDARSVSFIFNSRLWRMPLNGSAEPQLQPGFETMRNLTAARWSPDGLMIALLRGGVDSDQTLNVANADGGELRVLALLPTDKDGGGFYFSGPIWSPNGERLAVTYWDCTSWPCGSSSLMVRTVSDNSFTLLPVEGYWIDWR